MMELFRGRSTTAAPSKMEHFVIIVDGWKPLTVIKKSSILYIQVVPDPPQQKIVNPLSASVSLI